MVDLVTLTGSRKGGQEQQARMHPDVVKGRDGRSGDQEEKRLFQQGPQASRGLPNQAG